MKVAISLPDGTYERVERRVSELRISRSQFYRDAAERYLAELDAEFITEQANVALEAMQDRVAAAGAEAVDIALADEWRAAALERLDDGDDW